MNRKKYSLVEYGINHEESDIRAHVSVSDNSVYVFSTTRAKTVVAENELREVEVWSDVDGRRELTATGLLAPIALLKPRRIYCPELISAAGFITGGYEITSEKGRKAQWVVKRLMQQGSFPLPVNPQIVDDVDIQVDGADLIVHGDWRVQVKCDWRAGETGNIFIQVAERNPLGQF